MPNNPEKDLTTLRLNTPLDDVETQMRRALRVGSSGAAAGQRDQGTDNRANRRFAQSSDVPVTRLPARKDNSGGVALAAAEEALQAERQLREQAELALAQATATLTTLQTKLAHAEMAYAEALAAERSLHEATRRAHAEPVAPAPNPVAAGGKNREETPPDLEEEPVQWWVPGWQGDYRVR